MTGDDEVPMAGGWQTEVHQRGEIVLRSAKPQSRTVIALLAHLNDTGFTAAPQLVDDGFSVDGCEQLSFIAAESPQPMAWSDDAVWQVGHLLRRLHQATASFQAPPDAVWRPWFARTLPGTRPVIGHGDLGPWNVLARHGLPVAFIDWDNAGPVDAIWELAQVGWLNAQLHDDDVASLNDLRSPDGRARQLALILDGYQLECSARVGFVEKLIEFAIRSAREEAVNYDVGPDTQSPAPDRFPILWGVTWRARAAAWILDHRQLLDAALNA